MAFLDLRGHRPALPWTALQRAYPHLPRPVVVCRGPVVNARAPVKVARKVVARTAVGGPQQDEDKPGLLGRAFAALIGSGGGASSGTGQATPAGTRAGSGPRGPTATDTPSSTRVSGPPPEMLQTLPTSAPPSVIAAALVASRDAVQPKSEFPAAVYETAQADAVVATPDADPAPPAAAGRKAEPAAPAVKPQGPAAVAPRAGNGSKLSPKSNGTNGAPAAAAPAAPTTMISAAELDNMLSGLRLSLETIQESRARYVALLAERDTTILELRATLVDKTRREEELEAEVVENRRLISSLNQSLTESQAETTSMSAQVVVLRAEAAKARDEAAAAAAAAAEAAEASAALQAALEVAEAAAEAAIAAAAAAAPVEYEPLPAAANAVAPAATSVAQAAPAAPPAAPVPPPVAPPKEIELQYRSSWRPAYVHCCMDGKEWTQLPGLAMQSKDGDLQVLRLPCSKVEFVLTNGKGDWDSPPGNYKLSGPGRFVLEYGKMRAL